MYIYIDIYMTYIYIYIYIYICSLRVKDKRYCKTQQFSTADLLLVLKCLSSSEVQKKRGWFYRKSFTTSRKAVEVFRTCPPLSTATNTRWSKIDYDSWPD